MSFIAIDIGGSSIKSCRVEQNGGRFRLASQVCTTPLKLNEFSEIKDVVLGICRKELKDGADSVIGISTCGSVDNAGVVINDDHFKNYCNISWSDLLVREFGDVRVCTVNDGRASAWGEYSVAATKVVTHVHVVVGTGIGGGVIHNGELLSGDSGQAGYIGHIKVAPLETPICGCGKMGCVESLASARGIVAMYVNYSGSDRRLPVDVDFGNLLCRFKEDRQNIVDALKKSGYWLGVALGNVMNVLNPQLVTIGGGVVVATNNVVKDNSLGENPYFMGVNEGIHYAAYHRVETTGVVKVGVLGNTAGLLGVASLAFSKVCRPNLKE
ncbi:MAG: ROK family protein [Candidatus Bathyarchaeota archaeon]|nr:ROK family protein [Candidatus Termiticorpusculum sp.]